MAISSRVRVHLRRLRDRILKGHTEYVRAGLAAAERRLSAIEQQPRLDDRIASTESQLVDHVAKLAALEQRAADLETALARAEVREALSERLRLLEGVRAGGAGQASVSVIMATRNRARNLPAAIESVRAQTLERWELLIVDDGSTDDTASVVARYADDERIRYVPQSARGAAAARNRGLEMARGSLVAYLDSDNLYFPDFLLAAVEAFAADPTVDLVYGALRSGHHSAAVRPPLVWEPFDRVRLLRYNFVDLNAIVHRRKLFELYGGFDEALDRLLDWDLILKYTQHAPARPIPALAAEYRVLDDARITEQRSEWPAALRIRRKWQPVALPRPPLRVLYVLWHYPQLSETYIETELRCMRRWGVHVEVWAETTAASAYDADVPIHRGSLAEAVAAARPDLLHVHWLSYALAQRSAIDDVDLPVTIRVHGFEFTGEALEQALSWDRVYAIYGFPHHVAASARADGKLRAIPSAFDTDLFTPGEAKDRRLVVRTSAGLPSKDLALFFELAKRLPDHRFVLAAVTCKDRETCIDELRDAWKRSGTPAELHIDMPRDEIAALVGRAGIYVHTARMSGQTDATPIGGPISIAEAMATGAYLLVRDAAPLAAYVGDAGVVYRDVDHAASIIRATESWTDADWHRAWKRSIDRAYEHHADEIALRPILDDWIALRAADAGSTTTSAAQMDDHTLASGPGGVDAAWYLEQYADVAKAGIDPVAHYLEHGWREGRQPRANFSTSAYLARHPELAPAGINPLIHALRRKRASTGGASLDEPQPDDPEFDAFCRVIGRSPVEAAESLRHRRLDLDARLQRGELKDVVSRAIALEPLIARSSPAARTPVIPPFRPGAMREVAAIDQLQREAGLRRARAVVVSRVSEVRGAARIAGHLTAALAAIYGSAETLLVRTESSEFRSPRWFPTACRNVDFHAADHGLPAASSERVFVEFLRSLRPEVVFNVHSAIGWRVMQPYGKALDASMALYGYLFCNDVDTHGHPTGYATTEVYRHFDVLRAVITDSATFARELRERFQIPVSQSQKIVTLDTPMSPAIPLAAAPPSHQSRRPQIFWAGRFDRQKRPDIVMAIAARLPDVDLRVWGMSVLDDDFARLQRPGNVRIERPYRDFFELPLDQCDGWLYTSQWDGVPNVLLEVAAAGIPLISSVAGGASDVLIDGLCHRIANVEDVDAFVCAIRAVLADPDVARARARALRDRLVERRNPEAYRSALEQLLEGTR